MAIRPGDQLRRRLRPPDGLRPPPAQFLVPGANHLPIYRQRHLNYPLRREWIDKGLERQTIALAKGGA